MVNTNNADIDSLLRMLDQDGWEDYHAALTALVAERDGLKQRVAELEADLRLMMIPCERSTAAMTAEAQLRMTCSALTGIYANPNISGTPEANGENAAAAANAALAAMRDRLRQCVPPTYHSGIQNGPSDASCSVFAEKVIAQLDALRAELAAEKARAGDLSDEVNILRIYGSKKCTSRADEVLAAMRKGER